MDNNLLIIEGLSQERLSQKNILLLLLLLNDENAPKKSAELKLLGIKYGIRSIKNWSISSILNKAKGMCIHLEDGWIITEQGKKSVLEFLPKKNMKFEDISKDIRSLLKDIQNKNIQNFLSETLICLNSHCYRAAVVLSWVGAVSMLYDYVIKNYLNEFNNEATRRNAKWQVAKKSDDLSRMKEKEFLDVLSSLSILGKNVKQELEQCLVLRNSCGHPNSLEIRENRVASHLELLILNVYTKFNDF